MKSDILDNTFSTGGEYELECAIKLYGQSLLRYCHNILCDYHNAQDAVQITFIKAYNKRKGFKKGHSLSAWLYRIAYTTCIDILRKRKLLFFIPEINDIKEDVSIDYINEDLREALLKLTGSERALIYSRVMDEKSYKELELIYQVSSNTLRKRYERAKNKLIKALEIENSYYKRLEG
ncbi:sigma-70 family RNA polymerase sigma factor [Tissierella sp. Yu-01]|uniref:RNA polymerase sigma factor n=1 Tax=Tissierella sp. Yu-01 TaxID=3035694 RepID=UPI00240D0C14|nr:sigma-70 family RNA polymerase sigma factor [Tissierella sp. Yu-01]WFA08801.1 sigma-70 family RNA polymerase sigma factor [Tissierella sp. Yu-01]